MIRGEIDLTQGQWAQVRRIYDEVLDVPEDRRVDAALRLCKGDGQLESAIERLFATTGMGTFLDKPAGEWLLPPVVPLFPDGTILSGRFSILRFITSGGMGDVYEAWDANVREVVALKTIRRDLAAVPFAIERFREEVRHAHRINHPNVCRVHDLYRHDDESGAPVWFLTMQYLEGSTLLDHVRKHGPFLPAAALDLIEQMIAGLSAAHDLGVVHRDFKSSNVMLVDGDNGGTGGKTRAVITDFGLAVTTTITGEQLDGAALKGQGTLAYVAPEQWHDGVVSPASDQYSLGVVICEMVAGERPSCGSSAERADSPIELPKSSKLNAPWQSTIRRCTAPNPDDRFQSLAEILPALDPRRRQRGILLQLIRVLILPVAAVLGMFLYLRWSRPPRIVNQNPLTPALSLSVNPSLSTDGKTIAYASDKEIPGNLDIYVQRLPDGPARRITSDYRVDDSPSISPDGRQVLFRSERDGGGIYMTDTDGGSEKLLVPGGQEPKFSPDGNSFLYWDGDENDLSEPGRIYLFDLRSGAATQLAEGFADSRKPIWNSDGKHILFLGCASGTDTLPSCWDWWVTDVYRTAPRKTDALPLLARSGIDDFVAFGGWQEDRVLFSGDYHSETRLWREKILPEDPQAKGRPLQIISLDSKGDVPSSSVADSMHLSFTELASTVHLWQLDGAAVPNNAVFHKLTNNADFDFSPSVSHNGRWIIFARGLIKHRRLWLKDAVTGRESIFDDRPSDKFAPLIDDSGTTAVYNEWQNGVPKILISKAGGAPTLVCTECRNPTSWFDGTHGVLFSNATLSEIRLYDFAARSERVVLQAPDKVLGESSWSSENQLLAFTVWSPHSKKQVYVAHFRPGAAQAEMSWIPLSDPHFSADKPRWSGDGRTLYFFSKKDDFWCIWGQRIDPRTGRPLSLPFVARHFHDVQASPSAIGSRSKNLSVAGDSLFLNVAELDGTVLTGEMEH